MIFLFLSSENQWVDNFKFQCKLNPEEMLWRFVLDTVPCNILKGATLIKLTDKRSSATLNKLNKLETLNKFENSIKI